MSAASRVVLAGVVALSLAAASFALTVTPNSHNFGKAAIGGGLTNFRFTLGGMRQADTLLVALTGPDAADFNVSLPRAADFNAALERSLGEVHACIVALEVETTCGSAWVQFRPRSVGMKTATLLVRNSRNERATAQLTGEGVKPICTMSVVPCNYAHLYSGSFVWESTVSSVQGRTQISVTVTVLNGVATCNGAQNMWDASSGGMTGAITGKGLFAVEFEEDIHGARYYNITAACPSPDHPDMGGRSRPAVIGGDIQQQSYPQLGTAVGSDLVGTHSYPAPEVDPVNGVTGMVVMRWDLKRQP